MKCHMQEWHIQSTALVVSFYLGDGDMERDSWCSFPSRLTVRRLKRALSGSVVPSSNNSKPVGLGVVIIVHPSFGPSRVSCICPKCHLVATG